MPRSEREETLAALTARIFSSMLDELIMDATLQSHQEVLRSKSLCPVCNTRCGSIHSIASTTNGNDGTASGQRSDTPFSAGSNEAVKLNGTNGTNTPTNLKGDPGPLLECVVCSRPMAANRYAPHLSSCMGFNNTRRVTVRSNAKPSKPPSEEDRSPSPLSDVGELSDEKAYTNGKSKSKSKGKKTMDEADFTLKRKRPGSPQVSPNKKAKKGSPISRVKADSDISGLPNNSHFSPSTNSQSKIPSKLRDSSIASFQDVSSSSSRESSPDDAFAAPTPSSSFSSQSPTRPVVTNKAPRGRPPALGTGPPKRPTPPNRPIHVPDYHIEIDHANETGSSTDTDGE